jgi:hypothetical protein
MKTPTPAGLSGMCCGEATIGETRFLPNEVTKALTKYKIDDLGYGLEVRSFWRSLTRTHSEKLHTALQVYCLYGKLLSSLAHRRHWLRGCLFIERVARDH